MNTTADQVGERSGGLFKRGLCCWESVLQAVAESRGNQWEFIPQIATGLCGGISRSGNICGAVSGGVLAIGLCFGRFQPGQSPEETGRRVRAFLAKCEQRFGSTNCEKLIGCRLDNSEGQKFFKEHNLREKCAGFTQEAAQLASEILAGR